MARRLFQLVEPVALVTYMAHEPTEAVRTSTSVSSPTSSPIGSAVGGRRPRTTATWRKDLDLVFDRARN